MRVPRIYFDAELVSGQCVRLPQKQSNYLCKTLRMQVGRSLWLFNGQGGAYKADISLADAKKAEVLIGDINREDRQSPLKTELVIGLSKGDRFEFVLQKATELGVTRIQPVITQRSEVRLNAERMQKKVEHWQGILISTCEQSGRNLLPKLSATCELSDYLQVASDMPGILFDPRADQRIGLLEKPKQGFRVLIGPEGGFTDEEIHLAEERGFSLLTLGPRVLRTETAPLVALGILQSQFGDL